ncbi:hypothetical protein NW752_000031 [Fusarium irregulare]|uniref:F-box domain-containing protein n=1 Tax=Fusarium irregulare TaxID=2494466 RepID=A0A9W8PYY0_9HYPO|nr:hypothetical protein NW766_001811 [Fusarium irregulare]KAJ4027786.1 hypothetical protein NW752_000031 [Fusarium irregulare]
MSDAKHPRAVSLESLPPEILLAVITSLPGLDSLWNLLQASPHAWRLFEDGSTSLLIIEGIISGRRSIIPLKVRDLIRAVILVRYGVLPFEGLKQFRTQLMKAMIPCLTPDDTRVKNLGPMSLSYTPSPTVLRSIVATAYHITALSQSYLASCLERLRGPSFQPLHAHNPTPHYTHDYKDTGEWIPAWDREFAGKPLPVTHMGQPTWVEEMRVVRVMWIVQLVREMQLLATNKTGIVWSKDDIALLLGMDPVDLILDRDSPLPDTELIKSAMDYLATLKTRQPDAFYRFPPAPAPSVNNRWITASPNHNEMFMQVRGYRLNGKFQWLGNGLQVPEGATPVELPSFTGEKKWEQTAKAFDFGPYGVNFWQRLRDYLRSGTSPLPGVSFKSFRPLGLAFWDRKRLWLLGLANDMQYTSEELYFFVWEGILPPEEVDGIKVRAREAHRDRESRFPRPA